MTLTHSESPARVVRTWSRVAESCRSDVEAHAEQAEIAVSGIARPARGQRLLRCSRLIPRPLSLIHTCASRWSEFSAGSLIATVGLSSPERSARKSSKALSINSARHCHGANSMSPNTASNRGCGVTSMLSLGTATCSSDTRNPSSQLPGTSADLTYAPRQSRVRPARSSYAATPRLVARSARGGRSSNSPPPDTMRCRPSLWIQPQPTLSPPQGSAGASSGPTKGRLTLAAEAGNELLDDARSIL